MNLRKWALPLLLVLLMLPLQGASVSAKEFTNIDDFIAYFSIQPLGSSATISYSTPTFNTTAEYFEFCLNMTRGTDGTGAVEIAIPDCYMGLSVWEWNGTAWVLRDGASGWALSVPYLWNASETPAYDWGSSGLITGSGQWGTEKRVQLVVPISSGETKQLKIKVQYATEPAVGFDGVNDYVKTSEFAFIGDTLYVNETIKAHRTSTFPTDLDVALVSDAAQSTNVGFLWFFFDRNGYLYWHYATGSSYKSVRTDAPFMTENLGSVVHLYAHANYTSTDVAFYKDGVLVKFEDVTTPMLFPNASRAKYIGSYKSDVHFFSGIIYDIDINSDVVLNASSFSGGSNTTVTDFSGAGNHGTAYGNVQYKVYTGSGFKFTLPNRAPNAPTLLSPSPWWRFDPEATVRFQWEFNDPDDWDLQGAYQIQIGNNDFSVIYMDTGKINSANAYANITIPSNMTIGVYYWRVKTWDEYGAESPWSNAQALVVDKIKVESITTDKPLRNLGSIAIINVTLRYAWDSNAVESGTFTLNGIPMVHVNNGLWQAQDVQGYVHNQTYDSISGVEGTYGLATIDMNGQSLTIEWGRNITYNNTATEFNQLINFDIFNGVVGLFQFTLGDLFFAAALLGIMFLSAIRFQSLSIPALLGVICYAVFFNFMANTSRLIVGISLALFAAYAIYQAYTHED